MKLLTSLDQLEGKTIKHINHYNAGSYELFIVTKDKSVGSFSFDEWVEYGNGSVICNADTDEFSIFECYEDTLIKQGIVNEKEAAKFRIMEELREEARLRKVEDNLREARFEQYLQLKKEFEVEYKLD